MKKLIYILVPTVFAFLSSCDEIDDPIPANLGQVSNIGNVQFISDPSLGLSDSAALAQFIDTTNWIEHTSPDNSAQKFIILEEFTGHTCQNCPLGTREIIRLDGKLKDTLIPIAIHAGSFARNDPGGSKYFTDFRVEGDHGEDYSTLFNPGNAYPRGMVARLGGAVRSVAQWSEDINSIKNEAPAASLKLTNYYDTAGSVIRANIEIEWLQTLPDQYNLQVFVMEDHIIDWQKDDTDPRLDIPDYDHRHVLRKVVNDTFGKSLKAAVSGEKETIQYIFPFTEALVAGNEENIEVVAFIFNSDPSSYEVIQANTAHIK